jgi:hypothetical protein
MCFERSFLTAVATEVFDTPDSFCHRCPPTELTIVAGWQRDRIFNNPPHMPDGQVSPDPKDVAFYSATVNAWIQTRMEKDKTLLTLSSAAIGLLATLSSTVGPSTLCQFWIYVMAASCFVVTVITTILVFDRNSTHLEAVAKRNAVGTDVVLTRLDTLKFATFVIGIVLTAVIAASAGWAHLHPIVKKG